MSSSKFASFEAEIAVRARLGWALVEAVGKASTPGVEVKVTVDSDFEYERAIVIAFGLLEFELDLEKSSLDEIDKKRRAGNPMSLELRNGSCVTLILSKVGKVAS